MRSTALVVALSFAGLASLAVAERLLAPPEVPLSDLGAHEGERVRTTGRVARTARGPLALQDADARVILYAPRGAALAPGDEVTLVGLVARANGLVSLDAQRVLAATARERVALCDLARDAPRYVDTVVATEGALARASDLWHLAEGACAIDLASRPPEAEPATLGVARGTLRYDPEGARYVLEAEAWTPS